MYKRVLLKISGETFLGDTRMIDIAKVTQIAKEIKSVYDKGIQVVLVIGAGNIWRYRDYKDLEIKRVQSDSIGMLSTVMNSLVMQSVLENLGIEVMVCSSMEIPKIAENYNIRKTINYLNKKKIVICAGGTGNPFFTTDSAAALRALELDCDILLKATKVDGVYSSDPVLDPNAEKFDHITFKEVLSRDLYVMDQAAISLCKERPLSVLVFDMTKQGNIVKAASGANIGTTITFS